MKKEINVEIQDLDQDDTICGYRIKDLVAMARVLQRENITVIDLRKFVNNLEFAFKIVKNEFERQFDDQMSKFAKEKNESI